MGNATLLYEGRLWKEGQIDSVWDDLTIEHPFRISINGEVFTLTMHTPGDELALAIGLLYSEGVYKHSEIPMFHIVSNNKMNFIDELNLKIPEEVLNLGMLNKRNLLSASSCGICGTTALPKLEGHVNHVVDFTPEQIQLAFVAMKEAQLAYRLSGGCHGAAAFDSNVQLLQIKEDIGRHNAVDKVIGTLLLENQLSQARMMTVSGRVSFEIVYKCFAAGIPTLAAVSAPSSLAVDYCKELGIHLYGFCREGRITRYA